MGLSHPGSREDRPVKLSSFNKTNLGTGNIYAWSNLEI